MSYCGDGQHSGCCQKIKEHWHCIAAACAFVGLIVIVLANHVIIGG